MKYSCEIIKDLLPLYHDEVCSEESCIAIREHLSECTACKQYLENLNTADVLTPEEKETEQAKAVALSGVKKKFFCKKVLVSVISVLCAIAVTIGIISFIFLYEMPISYEDGLVNVKMSYDGVIDAFYQGRDYQCAHGMTKTVTINGIEKNYAYIYYTNSIWTQNFSRAYIPGTLQFSIGNGTMVDYGDNEEAIDSERDIAAVYYLVGDYSELIQMDNDEFLQAAQNSVLLWER